MKLMILDGNSVINRAFYGVRLLSTRDGLYTNAVYGFLNILDKMRQEEAPDALCVAFDLKGPTFRHEKYAAAYDAAFEKLNAMGLIYPCYCSRSEVHAASAPHLGQSEFVYAGTCRDLTEAQRAAKKRLPAWRLRVPEEEWTVHDGLQGDYAELLSRDCGDFVVRRADGVYAYQLAVVVDDADNGVTQVVRGRDLLASTPRQRYLFSLLGRPAPEYWHVPLLLAPDGRRLSKRDGDLDLGTLLERTTPEAIIGALAFSAGLIDKNEAISAAELSSIFDWKNVRKADICLQFTAPL